MHNSGLAAAVLGFWLAGSLFLYLVPSNNFRKVDQVLNSTIDNVKSATQKLAPGEARSLLRYLASEQNRWLFDTWERVQLLIGLLLTLLLLLSSSGCKSAALISLSMLILVAVMHWILNPEMIRLGREIDFLAADTPSAERASFRNYHIAYSALELAKQGLGMAALWLMVARSGKRRHNSRAAEED